VKLFRTDDMIFIIRRTQSSDGKCK